MASATSYIQAFNNHFFEFLDDVLMVFPNDNDILSAKNALKLIRKSNPKLIPTIWEQRIASKYRTPIEQGNLSYFIDKNYEDELQGEKNSARIMEAISRLREPIRQMSPENQRKVLQYIQNLTQLSLVISQFN